MNYKHKVVLLLVALSVNLGAFSQNLNLRFSNVTVHKAMTELKSRTGYSFVYEGADLNTKKRVTVNAQSVDEAVKQILQGQDATYKIQGKSIIVRHQIPVEAPRKEEVQQQKSTIKASGRVTDEKGEPIIGATVMEKGTNYGTVTDLNGRYSLDASAGSTLEISYIGYTSADLYAGINKNVTLTENAKSLNEVVVVGYGTQKKIDLTGAVASVSGDVLENRPINNISSGLQGLMPGITITGTNGAPGMDAGSIRIRGVGTLNNASPYILVDGLETSDINSIDPQDIANISVLKDAASAAIYGSKASNGVILITTKRGTTGKPRVSYNSYYGISNATMLMDRMNSADAATYYNMALARSGKSPVFTDDDIQKFRDGSDPYGHPNTNWYDLAYKTGFQNRQNVSVSGGDEFVKYLTSAGYLHQTSILPNAGREQFNVRSNLDMNISKAVTVHFNLSYIHDNYIDASSAYLGGSSDQIIRLLNRIAPWIPNKNKDGSYGTISDGNPMAWLDSGMNVKRKNQDLNGILGLDWQIYKDLKLTVNGAYVDNFQRYQYFQKFIQYNPNKASEPNHLEVDNYEWHRMNFDAYLNYKKDINLHHIQGMLGWHAERYKYNYDYAYRKNFPNNESTDMNAGDASTQQNSGYTRELTMVSYFGRLNYDWADRYLFETNFRGDASSRFAKGHRWGYFPSFSAAWRISEEPFMKNTHSWLDNLKIRASWGRLGNQDALTDYYPWMNTYSLGASYPFGGSLNTGYYQDSYHLETISWEKATTMGIGLDFTLFGTLTGSIDYYSRKTTGIIMDVSVPAEFALGAYKDNVGAMRNQGIEVSLGYTRKFGNDWRLNVSGNFAYNKNKVLNLGDLGVDAAGNPIDYIEVGDANHRNAIGHQYNSFYMYHWTGKFFNSQQEADDYTEKYGNPFGHKFMAGDLIFADTDGDGKLTDKDRIYEKNTDMPAITYSFNIGGSWKDFDISTLWQGVANVSHIFNREVLGEFVGDSGHPSTYWKKSWTEENQDARMPRVFETGTSASDMTVCMSDFWLWNTSYLRLKTLQVGYSLPKSLVRRLGLEKVRIYYSGENLLTIDNLGFKIDPEVTSERGSSYPLLRSHSIGFNIEF